MLLRKLVIYAIASLIKCICTVICTRLCIWIQAINRNCNTASKRNTQINLDQNSSSHVSCGVIGFDWRRNRKTVRDWIKPTGGNSSRKFDAPLVIKVLHADAEANYRNRKWEATDFEKILLKLNMHRSMHEKNIFVWAVFNKKYPRLIKQQRELQKRNERKLKFTQAYLKLV